MKKKCCLTCKNLTLSQDTYADELRRDSGIRVLATCLGMQKKHRPETAGPIWTNAVERIHPDHPHHRLETSFLTTFWCCNYEAGQPDDEQGVLEGRDLP